MLIDIHVDLTYRVPQPTDVILQIEASNLPGQNTLSEKIDIGHHNAAERVTAEGSVGQRYLIRTSGDFLCQYSAQVQVQRTIVPLEELAAVPPHALPGRAIRYLMPSRYCPSDELQSYVAAEFGHLAGGARIAAMRDWIFDCFQYVPGSSNGQTTAIDTFVQRQGVCRDFAHVLIALARASAIPARFASVYAPHVQPQDFHAVAEVYLDGRWHLVDATGMAASNQIVIIGVGMDAAEVAFLSSFGMMTLDTQTVDVTIT